MKPVIELPSRAWDRWCEVVNTNHKHHSSDVARINVERCLKFVGATRVRLYELPEKFKEKLERLMRRGYASGRGGNTWVWLNILALASGMKIGYIARQRMDFCIYKPRSGFVDELRALCGIVQKVGADFQVRDDGNGWRNIYGSARNYKEQEEQKAKFKELRLYVDTEMESYRPAREQAVALLREKRDIILPFSSDVYFTRR